MTSSTKIGIIGIATGIVIAVIGIFIFVRGDQDKKAPDTTESGGTTVVKETNVTAEDTERLHSREIDMVFQMTGKASDADWGIRGSTNFIYEVAIQAESRIVSKKKLDKGGLKVEEIRTFKKVNDSVSATNADISFALDTLPSSAIQLIAKYGGIFSAPAAGIADGMQILDGKGFRDALKALDIELPPDIDNWINETVGEMLLKWKGKARSINGKSYRITYYLKESGSPMHISFTYADGTDVTEEEEIMVLRRVNAFINSDLLPDINCKPGSEWEVDAGDLQEVFDPYVEGDYAGKIKVTRTGDKQKGEWSLELSPCDIRILSPSKTTTGSLSLEKGTAQVERDAYSVNDLFLSGTGNVSKTSRHHLLFNARFDGLCKFQLRVASKLLPEK